jgi:hypothetical protein
MTAVAEVMAEPPNGALLLMCDPSGGGEQMVVIRDDEAAASGGYGSRHWFEVRPDGDDRPATWAATRDAVDWVGTVWVRLFPFREGAR